MKKFILSLATLLLVCFLVQIDKNKYIKIHKIVSPSEIYIDSNKNFIFDETESYKIDKLYDINDFNDEISDNLKFLYNYFAIEYANSLLKRNFVHIKNNSLYIKNINYKDYLLKSGFFFDDTDISKKLFTEKLNLVIPDDYVIINNKSKKYHKINCKNGRQSKNYKIIHKNFLNQKYESANCCNDDNSKIIKQLDSNIYSDGEIQVFFLDLNSVMKPENTCITKACIALKNEIDNAEKSIDFAIYGFNNQPIIYEALKNAKKRGVKLRCVLNYDKKENAYYPEVEKLKKLISDYKTNQRTDEYKNQGLMHNKFFVFDNKKVFTGSANITSTDLSGFNANYSILINSSDAADLYKNEFEQMYKGLFGKNKLKQQSTSIMLNNDTKLTILFSPQHNITNDYLIYLINNATQYIYIPAFLITDKSIEAALINAKSRNIDIKIITDATNAKSRYSIHNNLRANNIKVKTENYAGKMHMKSIVIDDKYAVIGSMNFTSSGNKKNDENLIIIENNHIAKNLKQNFLYLWEKIPDKYLHFDPMAESLESIGSCYDGIDNDFDGKIDGQDEGCLIK